MQEELNEIKLKMIDNLNNVKTIKELNDLKVLYQGKKGIITEMLSKMKDLDVNERKNFAMRCLSHHAHTVYT